MHRRPYKLAVGLPKFSNYVRTLQILPEIPTKSTFNKHSSNISEHYSALIKQCIIRKTPQEIRKIRLEMMNLGYPNRSFGSKFIDAFIKCGSIDDAQKVFDEMRQRHIVTWNAMISAYIKQNRSKKAINLYIRMVSDGVLPDEFTFSSVFKAFSDLGLVNEAKKVHGQAVVLGLEVSNAFVGSALVDMYAKLGKLREARLIANRVVEKDVVLLTALIVGYNQSGDDHEALEVFGCMINDGVKANEYTFASVLICCGNLGELCFGRLIHGLGIKSGLEFAVASQTSLLTMYSKCGFVDDSLKVFDHVVAPNRVTWTSLIVGLAHNGREEVALLKFRQMMSSSVTPNSFTLSGTLRACSILAMLDQGKQIHTIIMKLGLDSQIFIGAALIDLYGKCGCVELAKLVYDRLSEPDLVSVNTMMYAYAQNGFGLEALELFHGMKDMGLDPNDVTLVSVLSACNNARLINEGRQIFASFRSKDSVNLTRDHYACMVDLLGRAGKLEEAESLINQVKNPDTVLWRTLLNACRAHGEVAMGERIISRVLEMSPGDEGALVLSSNLYASTRNWTRVIEMKSMIRGIKLKKCPAMSWVDLDREIHTFMAGDSSHPRFKEINETLEGLIIKSKEMGYVPDTRFVLQDLDERERKKALYLHSERLAIAFCVWKTYNKNTCIRIYKNLRVCGDCHSWIKIASKVVGREIVARDAKRFHHFRDGVCSCGDYW